MSRASATSTRSSTGGSSDQLEKTDFGELLDMPNDELMQAGNGTGEVRAWVAVAGAMHGHPGTTLSYEPIYEWINGMGVVMYEDELPSTV